MNTITIHNYEAYLLDSVEGSLTGELQLELDIFLIQHPELCVDLPGFSLLTFDPQKNNYTNKEQLKKTETDLVSENQFIAYVEGQLTENEKVHVEKSCALNPKLAKELELYNHTIVYADASVIFDNKQTLKRKPKVIWFNLRAASFAAAASVAVIVLLYFLWPAKSNETGNSARFAHTASKERMSNPISNSIIHNNSGLPEKQLAATYSLTPLNKKNYNAATVNNSVTIISAIASTATITLQRDTLHIASVKEPVTISEEQKMVSRESLTHKTVVDVISENDDEEHATIERKPGFWSIAGKALKNLNKAGVKAVNGEENAVKDDAAYALTLGDLNITHSSH